MTWNREIKKKNGHKVTTLLVVFLIMAMCSLGNAKTAEECETENFKTCAFGFNWGENVSEETVSLRYCSKVKTPIKKVLSTSDWCIKLKKGKTSSSTVKSGKVCAVKGSEYCYFGRSFVRGSNRHPHPSVATALHFAGLGGFKTAFGKEMETESGYLSNMNKLGYALYPMGVPSKKSKKAKYLITWWGIAVGIVVQSEIPKKIDPKYFLITADKKYGKADLETFKKPLQGRYTNAKLWATDGGVGLRVIMTMPKELSPDGKARIESFYINNKMLHTAFNKMNSDDSKTKKVKVRKKSKKLRKAASDVEI